jgi:hypothetical protein
MSKQVSAVHNLVSDRSATSFNSSPASSSTLGPENICFDLPCVTESDLLSLERDVEDAQKFACLVSTKQLLTYFKSCIGLWFDYL